MQKFKVLAIIMISILIGTSSVEVVQKKPPVFVYVLVEVEPGLSKYMVAEPLSPNQLNSQNSLESVVSVLLRAYHALLQKPDSV